MNRSVNQSIRRPYDGYLSIYSLQSNNYNPYEELACAIVYAAVTDYLNPNATRGERASIARFFKSNYFSILMPNINGEELLIKLKKELTVA